MNKTERVTAYHEFKEHGIISHPGMEKEWNAEIFIQELRVSITNISDTINFDLVNVDCSFANALRRILISEVPSVSIDRVYLHQNTSVMPDEVLCHRIGLIPLTTDPKHLGYPSQPLPLSDDLSGFTTAEHLVFDIKAKFNKCDVKSTPGNVDREATNTVQSMAVYSSALQWIPLPGQEETFSTAPSVVFSNILLDKLAVGDELDARCLAVKGIGRDHAKFSPVSAAYYKFLPTITLQRPIEGEEAKLLQKCFTPGVIGIEPKTEKAYVIDARLDNGSREHLRFPQFKDDSVSVSVNPDHCLFTVESIAPEHRPPARLVRMAFDVMINKCKHYLAIVQTPGFGDIATDAEYNELSFDSTSTSTTARSLLNGREVGLEVTHMSRDKQRVTYTFHGEDHTLGLSLRICILHSTKATFCGYCVPHPLEDKIHFDVQIRNGSAHNVLREGLQCLLDCFLHMKKAFKEAMSSFKKETSASE